MESDHRWRRERRSAEASLTSGLIFTVVFGVAWALLPRMWWFVFPLVFAGILPAMQGIRRMVQYRSEQRDRVGNREAWAEKQILRTAREERGVVTPALIALKTDLTIAAAEKVLEHMARRGYAEMRINPSGRIEYTFPEFLPDVRGGGA